MTKTRSDSEFIALMAFLMSLVALTIDIMLPALDVMRENLGVSNPNDIQLVISTVFLGMAMGQLLYGPFADSYGRKNAIYLGLSIYLLGTLVSIFASNLSVMLVGRVIQGFGASCSRVVSLAMIRDRFVGRQMGRIMSLIMIVFILVPALAPALGQALLLILPWRFLFFLFLIVGVVGLLWLGIRQPETLSKDKRIPFSVRRIGSGTWETLSNRTTLAYTLASGLVFGAFVGYLSTSQQLLQIQYELGKLFSVAFGGLALAVGLSSYLNSKWVMRMSMERLCLFALVGLCLAAVCILPFGGHPPFFAFISYLAVTLFCFGLLFANLNTLAVQPLGHIAGIANSVISSVQTFFSVAIGGWIGHLYSGSILPLALGFLICSTVALGITFIAVRGSVQDATT